jgi:RNA polymerase sigma-70 factor (ECF subfamily)
MMRKQARPAVQWDLQRSNDIAKIVDNLSGGFAGGDRMTTTGSGSTETTLLQKIAETSDPEPWARFVKRYVPMIQRFARRQGLQETDVHDVVQETLIAVQRLLADGTYDPSKGRFRFWLRGVVFYRVLHIFEARTRFPRAGITESIESPELLEEIPAQGGDELIAIWEQEWEAMVLQAALEYARGRVSKLAFKAFELYALQEWPVEEVAKHLKIAPSSVYVYKSRVLELARQRAAEFETL